LWCSARGGDHIVGFLGVSISMGMRGEGKMQTLDHSIVYRIHCRNQATDRVTTMSPLGELVLAIRVLCRYSRAAC